MPGAACLVPEGFYGRLIVVVAVLSVEDDLALCVNEEQGTDHGAAQALHRRGAQGACEAAVGAANLLSHANARDGGSMPPMVMHGDAVKSSQLQVVSATPPSIATEALVLGGPECAVC